uniref:F-box domain-containing protein n=1 Tax=Setaria italica TaxID=4555 RepID=K4A0X9_SETIT
MGKEIRRQTKITWNWKRRRNRLMARATSVHDLTNDLLELVFLSLDSRVCLACTAATCKHWYHVMAGDDGAFLIRFRSLHPPRAIGTYYSINLDTPNAYGRSHLWPEVDPVFVPSPASTFDGSSELQLSLNFVSPSNNGPRELVDGRGSLLLLLLLLLIEKECPHLCSCMCCYNHGDYMTPGLVAILPPDDGVICILNAFLLNSGAAVSMLTNFCVLLVLYEYHENGSMIEHGYLSANVFTSGSNGGGRWHQ